jgi:CRP/FNR family transcriptional regulator, cyclic AMP receptor protein
MYFYATKTVIGVRSSMKKMDNILARLFEDSRYFLYERGDTIIRAGDTPSGVYLITTGWVKVYSLCEDGEINIIMNLGDGDIFPLDWAITGRLHDITFAALDATTVQRIPREKFIRALRGNIEISTAASFKLASYLLRLSYELEHLPYRSARERVAFRLVCLAEHFGEKNGDQITIRARISNEYVARSTNMTRETASREMSRLARKRLIQTVNGYIHIKDMAALTKEVGKTFAVASNKL